MIIVCFFGGMARVVVGGCIGGGCCFFFGGMARVLVVDCIDDDYCLFFRGNGSCSCS